MNSSMQKPDSIGVLSSILCMIHCIATPFFLLQQLVLQHAVVQHHYGGSG